MVATKVTLSRGKTAGEPSVREKPPARCHYYRPPSCICSRRSATDGRQFIVEGTEGNQLAPCITWALH